MIESVAIRISNVSKKYILQHPKVDTNGIETHEHLALNNVSFDVKKGQSIGIIGPNGSGKSTLLRILSGITKPTLGEIEIDGRVASILDIGAGFHPELTGKENIYLNGSLLGFSRKEIKLKYDEIVAFSGINNFIDEPVKNYSNGMYLRLAFSILAHLDFDVYLFDEVMGVGDIAFAHKCKEKIEELKKEKKTTLLVTHSLNELLTADHVIEFERGKIVKTDTPENLLMDYAKRSLMGSGGEIHEHGVKKVDFNTTQNNVKLLSVTIYQDGDTDKLLTSNSTFIEICYTKNTPQNTVDPLLIVTDINGVVVFSSSPIISGTPNSNTEINTLQSTCTVPPNLLSNHIYTLSIVFLKNGFYEIQKMKHFKPNNTTENDEYGVESVYNDVLKLKFDLLITNLTNDVLPKTPSGVVMPLLKWETINMVDY